MKRVIVISVLGALLATSSFASDVLTSVPVEQQATDQQVVFRSLQKLKSSDGREIELYPSRKCLMYDNGRLMVETTYSVANGDVRLLDENGRIVYKGSYRLKKDGCNLSSLTIAGTTYYAR